MRRRRWHPSQKIAPTDDGIELVLDVVPKFELDNWILSFGDMAVVLEPADVRERIAAKLRRAAVRYDVRT